MKSNLLFIHYKNMLHMINNSIITVKDFFFSLCDQLVAVLHPYSFQGWSQLESSLPSIVAVASKEADMLNQAIKN